LGVTLTDVRPMLASSAVNLPQGDQWSDEVKVGRLLHTRRQKRRTRHAAFAQHETSDRAQYSRSRAPWRKSVRRPRCLRWVTPRIVVEVSFVE
jgi:hypothetical protein